MLGPPPLREASLNDLVSALKRVVEKSKDEGTWVYEVNSQKLTLRSVILEVAKTLQNTPRVDFEELFDEVEVSRHRIITTFLALLEMTRMKMVKLFQSKLKGNRLYVERAVIDIVEVSQELELESETA
jgi:segregation and condensation protein A